MRARVLLLHYAWPLALRAFMRSRRWSPESKVVLVATVGPIVAILTIGSWLLWVVTGRGRRLVHLLGFDTVVANPFGGPVPRDVMQLFDEARARIREQGPPARPTAG